MRIHAKGILRHRFWGEYSAVIALEFSSEDDSKVALTTLGNPWKVGEKHTNILVWTGNSEELDKVKETLGSFGADVKKIDSMAKSIDYGEWFYVTIPVENPDQLSLL